MVFDCGRQFYRLFRRNMPDVHSIGTGTADAGAFLVQLVAALYARHHGDDCRIG